MTLQSLGFFAFTAIVLVLYYLLPRKGQNLWLLLTSYFFYVTISWKFAIILAVMTLVNYAWAHYIVSGAVKDKKKRLVIGIGLNGIVWLFFKTAHFFVPQILALIARVGLPIHSASIDILLPVGLSFYTLQAISYLVDVSRQQVEACKNPVDFALYMAYFPKLTAGPIERASAFLPQLAGQRKIDNDLLARSFTLLAMGLFRKIVVADTLLQAIPKEFIGQTQNFSALQLVAWVTAGIFGIYNDFCGYTNIARGISGFFGIHLTRNFAHPLFARNLSEFWGRWHISLSSWLRDYIYFPLSRTLVRRHPSLKNKANIILPPLVTMTVSAIWHNPQLSYLSWGAFMGVAMAGTRLLSAYRPLKAPGKRPLWRQLCAMVPTSLMGLGIPIVLVSNFSTLGTFLHNFFSHMPWMLPQSRVFLMILPALWIDIMQYRAKDETLFIDWPLWARASLLGAAAITIFLFAQARISEPFIYQGF